MPQGVFGAAGARPLVHQALHLALGRVREPVARQRHDQPPQDLHVHVHAQQRRVVHQQRRQVRFLLARVRAVRHVRRPELLHRDVPDAPQHRPALPEPARREVVGRRVLPAREPVERRRLVLCLLPRPCLHGHEAQLEVVDRPEPRQIQPAAWGEARHGEEALDAVVGARPVGGFLADGLFPVFLAAVPGLVCAGERETELLEAHGWWEVVEDVEVAIKSEGGEDEPLLFFPDHPT